MERILYTVTATLPDEGVAREYIAWLKDGHVDAVVAGGAHSAMIVRLEAEPGETSPQVQTQYVFATRERFDHYVRTVAPALREDGVKRFGPDRGVRMVRRIGEIV